MAGVNTDNSDRIKESLNACLTTCLKLPEQAQGEVIRELSYISKITISKEKCLTTTDKALHQLPRALSQLDELIDGINIKSNASILQTLELLRSVNGKKEVQGTQSGLSDCDRSDKKWSECIDALHDLENLCQPDASSAAPPLPVGSSSTDRPDNISSAAPPLLSVGNSSADMNSTTSGMIDPKTRMQMLAVANIHLFSQRGDWNAVLRLRPPDSSDLNPRDVHVFPAAEVRRQYRRMAALVHPDKCGLPHTTEAFDLLARAQDELLGISCRGKKRKHDANREGDESDHFSETFTPDEGFEWWGEWDIPPSSAARRSTCVGGEPHPRAPSHADAEDQAFLRGLTLEELRAEVLQRQHQVLNPPPATGSRDPPPFDVHARQRRLRLSRGILSGRIKEEEAALYKSVPYD